MSDEFEWDLERPEVARDVEGDFDVRAAKELLIKCPRPVEQIDLAKYGDFFRELLGEVRLRPDTDWERVDPTLPVIFARECGLKFPIDGRHRLAKAVREGQARIPAVVLTDEETEAIRLR